jgi:hypothetical protein
MICTVIHDESRAAMGLVAEWGGRKYPVCCINTGQRRRPAHRVADVILRTLDACGQAVSFNNFVYFSTGGGWATPMSEGGTHHLLNTLSILEMPVLPSFAEKAELRSPAVSKHSETTPDVYFWAAALGRSMGLEVTPSWELAREVVRYMLNQETRRNPAPVQGILQHPLIGKPRGRWVGPPLPDSRTETEGHSYTWLPRLLGPLNLTAPSHCIAMSYLLGLFHAASLDYARPILFVDSWVRGRGKSELGRALVRLLDNRDDSIVLASKGLSETVTSHLIRGGRVLLGQNMNDVLDWNSEYLASLATDGSVGDRPKYGRTTAFFRGVATILNGVYGSFTLAEDMVARIWRVELTGPCPQRELGIPDFAEDHREDIIREVSRAYSYAQPWTYPTLSRCNEFERVALPAYAEVTGMAHEKVFELYKQALVQSGALATPCVQHLHHGHSARFERPSDVATGGVRVWKTARNPGPQYHGVRALGMYYSAPDNAWKEDA